MITGAVRCLSVSEQQQRNSMSGTRPGTILKLRWLPSTDGGWIDLNLLLTEAEWEYTARAGTSTPFSTGGTITTKQANFDGNYTFGDSTKGTYRQKTVDVGSFPPNAFGLHDMHGNVWEWVEDCYKRYADDGSAVTDVANCNRVQRGGSWGSYPRSLRSASRNGYQRDGRDERGGFRLARTLGP